MSNKREDSEAEKLLKIQKSIINTLKHRKNVEEEYLYAINKLLDYWKNKLDNIDSQGKKKDKVLEIIEREENTIKKIKEDIKSIDEEIEKIEKNLEKK